MNNFIIADGINVDSPHDCMILVFNRSFTAQEATEDGKYLGGKEFAWVKDDDAIVLNCIKTGLFRLIKSGTVSTSENSFSDNANDSLKSVKPTVKKRKPQK